MPGVEVQNQVVATTPLVAEGFEPIGLPPLEPIPIAPAADPEAEGRPPGESMPIASGPPTIPEDEHPLMPDRPVPVPAAECCPGCWRSAEPCVR